MAQVRWTTWPWVWWSVLEFFFSCKYRFGFSRKILRRHLNFHAQILSFLQLLKSKCIVFIQFCIRCHSVPWKLRFIFHRNRFTTKNSDKFQNSEIVFKVYYIHRCKYKKVHQLIENTKQRMKSHQPKQLNLNRVQKSALKFVELVN